MKSSGQNIRLYLLISIVGSMDLTRGVFTLFLASRGVSPGEIGLLQTILFLTSLVFDVPTGMFADRHRRRTSLAIGFFLVGFSSLLMPFSSHYIQFAGLFALQGLGFAFRSGAGSAWLFDNVSSTNGNSESIYLKISSLCRTFSNLALAFAIAAGPWLRQRGTDWSLTYWMFSGLMIMASVLSLRLSEPIRYPNAAEEENESAGLVGKPSMALIQSIRNFCNLEEGRRLLIFIGITAFLEASNTPLFIFMQLKLKTVYVDERWVGFAVAIALGFSSLALCFVPMLERIPLRKKMVWALFSTSVTTFALAITQSPEQVVPLFCLANAIPSLLFVFTDKVIQDQIPAKFRASFLSVHSAITSIAISLSYLIVGEVVGHADINAGIALLAFLPLVSIAALEFSGKRDPLHVFA